MRQNSKVHVKVNFVLKTIRKLLKDLRDEFKKKYVRSLETNCFFLNLVHSTKVICVTRLLNQISRISIECRKNELKVLQPPIRKHELVRLRFQ